MSKTMGKEDERGYNVVYKGGYGTYGFSIGVLLLEATFPRIPGDVGNATTFNFPIRLKVVKGATSKRVVQEQDSGVLENFIKAAKELVKEGVRAICSACGFTAMFQREIAAAVEVPFFSCLLQVPIIYRMLQPDKKIGIITADASRLHQGILDSVGAADVPVAIGGMENQHEFTCMRKEMNQLDPQKARAEVMSVVKNLLTREPKIGAIIMECGNLPPYSKAVRDATSLPVFDVITLIKWVHSALIQEEYKGFI